MKKYNIFIINLLLFITAALSFLVANAWDNAISSTIERFVHVKNTYIFKLIYALILSIVIILIFYLLSLKYANLKLLQE